MHHRLHSKEKREREREESERKYKSSAMNPKHIASPWCWLPQYIPTLKLSHCCFSIWSIDSNPEQNLWQSRTAKYTSFFFIRDISFCRCQFVTHEMEYTKKCVIAQIHAIELHLRVTSFPKLLLSVSPSAKWFSQALNVRYPLRTTALNTRNEIKRMQTYTPVHLRSNKIVEQLALVSARSHFNFW